ncbi:MAG: thioredoxin domain-containing protein [Candidatus Sedimenticola sp. (ex Thyasira tokunagai)]
MNLCRIAVITGLLLSSFSMTGWAESSTAAKVGDWQVTVEDVDAALGQKLYELDKKRYQLRVMEVQNRLNQYLLESEAKAKSTDISELIKGAINERVQKVSDEDAKSFMATNAGRIPEGVTEAQVKGFLLEQERKRVLGGYIRTLQEKYGAEILLEEPLAPRVEIRGSQELSKGPSDAKITIVEFSDFECPFCSKVQGTLGEVLKAYPEDVRLVYRHFPLSFHRNALTASEATMCAQDQGKFWPMHDEIFSDQKNIAVDDLKKHAETIGLEMTEFNNCLDQRTHKEYVTADVNEASRIGVSATPTFYVNGVKLEGGYDMSNFSKAIDRELKKM